ncbi:MAG: 50S ribosomal protein L28 [Pseudomonadota bacterium]
MSRICELTGKRREKGNKVSHSNIKTRRFLQPNLVKKKWQLTELKKSVTLTLSASALRTIQARGGLERALMLEKDENLSDRLLGLKREILKRRTEKTGSSKGEEAHAVQN